MRLKPGVKFDGVQAPILYALWVAEEVMGEATVTHRYIPAGRPALAPLKALSGVGRRFADPALAEGENRKSRFRATLPARGRLRRGDRKDPPSCGV